MYIPKTKLQEIISGLRRAKMTCVLIRRRTDDEQRHGVLTVDINNIDKAIKLLCSVDKSFDYDLTDKMNDLAGKIE